MLDKNKWIETKKWEDTISSFNAFDVWKYGTHIYYSAGENSHYELIDDKWVKKSWNGKNDFSGKDIWTDGSNVYISDNEKQYILNGNNWEPKQWEGLNELYAPAIWTDGENYYYITKDIIYKFK